MVVGTTGWIAGNSYLLLLTEERLVEDKRLNSSSRKRNHREAAVDNFLRRA